MTVDIGPGRPLVFNHIPKTAGTALTVALGRAVDPQHPFMATERNLLGGREVQALSPAARSIVVSGPEEIPAGSDFVCGHISPATTRARFPHATEMTILREPKARLVSHWLFSRTYQDFMLRGWGAWADDVKAARVPLSEFLANPRIAYYTDNAITRFLITPHDLTPFDRFIDEADDDAVLEAAFASLDRFHFLGVLEDPDLATSLSTWLGHDVRIERANETQPLPPTRRCDVGAECAGAAELLAARTRLDARLWDRLATPTSLVTDDSPAEERDRIFAAAIARHERLAELEVPGVLTRTMVSSMLRLRARASSAKHYIRSKTNPEVYAGNG